MTTTSHLNLFQCFEHGLVCKPNESKDAIQTLVVWFDLFRSVMSCRGAPNCGNCNAAKQKRLPICLARGKLRFVDLFDLHYWAKRSHRNGQVSLWAYVCLCESRGRLICCGSNRVAISRPIQSTISHTCRGRVAHLPTGALSLNSWNSLLLSLFVFSATLSPKRPMDSFSSSQSQFLCCLTMTKNPTKAYSFHKDSTGRDSAGRIKNNDIAIIRHHSTSTRPFPHYHFDWPPLIFHHVAKSSSSLLNQSFQHYETILQVDRGFSESRCWIHR